MRSSAEHFLEGLEVSDQTPAEFVRRL